MARLTPGTPPAARSSGGAKPGACGGKSSSWELIMVYGAEVVGRRIKLCKPKAPERNWECVTLEEFDPVTGLHKLRFAEGSEDWVLLQETRCKFVDDPPPDAAPNATFFGSPQREAAVGRTVRVYWPGMTRWYKGVVKLYDPATDKHRIDFKDGDSLEYCLRHEAVVWLEDGSCSTGGVSDSDARVIGKAGSAGAATNRQQQFAQLTSVTVGAAPAGVAGPPASVPKAPIIWPAVVPTAAATAGAAPKVQAMPAPVGTARPVAGQTTLAAQQAAFLRSLQAHSSQQPTMSGHVPVLSPRAPTAQPLSPAAAATATAVAAAAAATALGQYHHHHHPHQQPLIQAAPLPFRPSDRLLPRCTPPPDPSCSGLSNVESKAALLMHQLASSSNSQPRPNSNGSSVPESAASVGAGDVAAAGGKPSIDSAAATSQPSSKSKSGSGDDADSQGIRKRPHAGIGGVVPPAAAAAAAAACAAAAAEAKRARLLIGLPSARSAAPAAVISSVAAVVDTLEQRNLLVGSRVAVYWGDDDMWYKGKLTKHAAGSGRYMIRYDDVATEWLNLEKEKFRWLSPRGRSGNYTALLHKVAFQLGAVNISAAPCAELPASRPESADGEPPASPQGALGRRLALFWQADGKWYPGEVLSYNGKSGRHHVMFADGEEEWLDLSKEMLAWSRPQQQNTVLVPLGAGLPEGVTLPLGDAALGWRVAVYWKDDTTFYEGRVIDFDSFSGRHTVRYDDGEHLPVMLHNEKVIWRIHMEDSSSEEESGSGDVMEEESDESDEEEVDLEAVEAEKQRQRRLKRNGGWDEGEEECQERMRRGRPRHQPPAHTLRSAVANPFPGFGRCAASPAAAAAAQAAALNASSQLPPAPGPSAQASKPPLPSGCASKPPGIPLHQQQLLLAPAHCQGPASRMVAGGVSIPAATTAPSSSTGVQAQRPTVIPAHAAAAVGATVGSASGSIVMVPVQSVTAAPQFACAPSASQDKGGRKGKSLEVVSIRQQLNQLVVQPPGTAAFPCSSLDGTAVPCATAAAHVVHDVPMHATFPPLDSWFGQGGTGQWQLLVEAGEDELSAAGIKSPSVPVTSSLPASTGPATAGLITNDAHMSNASPTPSVPPDSDIAPQPATVAAATVAAASTTQSTAADDGVFQAALEARLHALDRMSCCIARAEACLGWAPVRMLQPVAAPTPASAATAPSQQQLTLAPQAQPVLSPLPSPQQQQQQRLPPMSAQAATAAATAAAAVALAPTPAATVPVVSVNVLSQALGVPQPQPTVPSVKPVTQSQVTADALLTVSDGARNGLGDGDAVGNLPPCWAQRSTQLPHGSSVAPSSGTDMHAMANLQRKTAAPYRSLLVRKKLVDIGANQQHDIQAPVSPCAQQTLAGNAVKGATAATCISSSSTTHAAKTVPPSAAAAAVMGVSNQVLQPGQKQPLQQLHHSANGVLKPMQAEGNADSVLTSIVLQPLAGGVLCVQSPTAPLTPTPKHSSATMPAAVSSSAVNMLGVSNNGGIVGALPVSVGTAMVHPAAAVGGSRIGATCGGSAPALKVSAVQSVDV